MTKNMAARGEGLAGLVAKWRKEAEEFGKIYKETGRDTAFRINAIRSTCADELEAEITALEAAAPAGTARRSKLELSIAEECLKPAIDLLNDAIWDYRETVTIKRGALNYAVELAREALATHEKYTRPAGKIMQARNVPAPSNWAKAPEIVEPSHSSDCLTYEGGPCNCAEPAATQEQPAGRAR